MSRRVNNLGLSDEHNLIPLADVFDRPLKKGDLCLYGLDVLYRYKQEEILENNLPEKDIYEAPLFQIVNTGLGISNGKTDFPDLPEYDSEVNYVYKIEQPTALELEIFSCNCILNDFYGDYEADKKAEVSRDVFLRPGKPGDFVVCKVLNTFFELKDNVEYGILISSTRAFIQDKVIDVYAYYIVTQPSDEEMKIKEKLQGDYMKYNFQHIKKLGERNERKQNAKHRTKYK